ncbi:hypothetical protein HPB50_008073 [Hyalomma asiaticum]|uniref:Uncharacterized protein n=1 Tax=Hyalomma asiaticum TaxID=266040 RepID=A0ACB7RTV7_HYAAI|nr:hypothetical protein HPB50_008073 [Hyalomma asiaticum]
MTVSGTRLEANEALIECVCQDSECVASDREILILGDFNGHISELDEYTDANGKLLLRLAERLQLNIANLDPRCEGKYTWCARGSATSIDYVLVSHRLTRLLNSLHIDEEGNYSAGSDHNRMRIDFSRTQHLKLPRRCNGSEGQMHLSEKAIERVAAEFEDSQQRREANTYEEYIATLRSIMHRHKTRNKNPTRHTRKPWWDKEVAQAWQAHREANRAHRRAVKTEDPEVCSHKWKYYLQLKHEMQALIQVKLANANRQMLQELRDEGRSTATKFWCYKGYCVSNAQTAKELGNKKGKLACKDTAQALWSSSVLATRSVSGNVAPKKKALGELPKQQLTPEKVDVVAVDMFLFDMAQGTDYRLDFAHTKVLPETFYARANGTRVISFFEILSSSTPGVALTVSCVALCALLLAAMNSSRSFFKSASVEITFLLATLFAQSSPIPRHRRHAGSRRVIYLLLLLGLFPLSVYIRGELTSCITVTRPADYLDTLDELGRALDDGTVAACAARDTSQASAMSMSDQWPSSTIMRKLQAAYIRHGRERLILQSTRHCLRCTRQSDRVCFTLLQPACVVREESAEAQPFSEHLGIAMAGLPLRYASPHKAALRDLLLRVGEAALDTEAAPDCKYREPPAPTVQAVELLTFFRQYCALLALTTFVFFAECATGWLCRRCS